MKIFWNVNFDQIRFDRCDFRVTLAGSSHFRPWRISFEFASKFGFANWLRTDWRVSPFEPFHLSMLIGVCVTCYVARCFSNENFLILILAKNVKYVYPAFIRFFFVYILENIFAGASLTYKKKLFTTFLWSFSVGAIAHKVGWQPAELHKIIANAEAVLSSEAASLLCASSVRIKSNSNQKPK